MEPNQTPETPRSLRLALIKLLAIAGFFALLALLLWALVQGVRLFPTAFSSLSQIAETISSYRPEKELELELGKSIVNSGETFTLFWNDLGEGAYTLSYECTLDAMLSVRTGEGTLKNVLCTESITMPEDTKGLFVAVTTRAQRFSDIPLHLTFEDEDGNIQETEGLVTVVNATIPTQVATLPPTPTTTPVADTPVIPLPEKPATTPESEEVTPVTPKPTTPVAKPTPTPTTISYLPISNPNGSTDLRTSFSGVGVVRNGIFVPRATFEEGETGAFQFEVKNIGTKTSASWTYTLELPGGLKHTSGTQISLKPNERALFTVNVDIPEANTNSVTLKGSVSVTGDTNSKNNSFSWSVKTTN